MRLPCASASTEAQLLQEPSANDTVADQQLEDELWLSVGSVGHPHRCAGACRYVKRRGGCRDGAICTKCHLCFWRRGEEPHAASKAEGQGVAISAGTRGHPHRCGAPCRYVRRKGGCRDGASCPNCHVCLWQRERDAGTEQEEEQQQQQEVNVVVPDKSSCAVFGESGKTLQELIEAMLHEQTFGR